jgi:hypothetical protein
MTTTDDLTTDTTTVDDGTATTTTDLDELSGNQTPVPNGTPDEPEPVAAEADDADDEEQPETFPREYVEKLRKESAGYRERAGQADQLAERLHTALVAATGRLADPTDLPFDVGHLDDAEALTAAIDELVERKPHLKTRRPSGDVGQGAGGAKGTDVNLADLLRARA